MFHLESHSKPKSGPGCLTATSGRKTSALIAAAAGAFLTLAAVATAHAEDVAICAGVNNYPGLRAGANLNGCVNDAKIFAKKLEQMGFHNPIVLADADANKQGILGKISGLKDRLHPGDRVVVFFAGHGTLSSSGESVLLPSDAQDASEDNDIQVKELYDAVKGLGDEVTKTIVLDSCHSGGMIRGVAGLRSFHNMKPRFYVRTRDLNKPAKSGKRDIKRWQETDTNGGDDLTNVVHDDHPNVHVTTEGGITYFTAAQKNEVANETEVGGEEHGLFTYYLVNALKDPGSLWKDVNADVSSKVWADTEYEQKPQLFPSSEMDRVVFGGTATPKPKPLGLDDIYALSNPDPSSISLKRFLKGSDPELAPVEVDSRNYFEIKVGKDGYLVVIGRDPSNTLDILFPKVPTAEGMMVHAGQVIRIPGNPAHYMTPDTAGTDGVKAILFGGAEKANAMVAPFEKPGGRDYKSLTVKSAARAWHEKGDEDDNSAIHFYTSEITTQIVAATGAGH